MFGLVFQNVDLYGAATLTVAEYDPESSGNSILHQWQIGEVETLPVNGLKWFEASKRLFATRQEAELWLTPEREFALFERRHTSARCSCC